MYIPYSVSQPGHYSYHTRLSLPGSVPYSLCRRWLCTAHSFFLAQLHQATSLRATAIKPSPQSPSSHLRLVSSTWYSRPGSSRNSAHPSYADDVGSIAPFLYLTTHNRNPPDRPSRSCCCTAAFSTTKETYQAWKRPRLPQNRRSSHHRIHRLALRRLQSEQRLQRQTVRHD